MGNTVATVRKNHALETVRRSPAALRDAGKLLQADRDVVLEAVRSDGLALEYASPELRADKAIVLEAVKRHGEALEFADEEVRADKVVVLEALQRHASALQHASAKLRADRCFVLEALQLSERVLAFASEDLRHDEVFMREAVKRSGSALRLASEELKDDKAIVLEAVKQGGLQALCCASLRCRQEKDLLLLAVRHPASRPTLDDTRKVDTMLKALHLERTHFLGAELSQIAVQGEEAPVVSATLSRSCSHDGESKVQVFHCEAYLMSGASFECHITEETSTNRSHAIVVDLIKDLVCELARHSKAANSIFVHLTRTDESGEEEIVPITPWDWDRPLSEYLPPARDGDGDGIRGGLA